MEEETKEFLAKMCCKLMDELAVKPSRQYEFLDEDFLELMNDIGRLGHEKFGADAFEIAGGKRRIARHQKEEILRHARQHLAAYEQGIRHTRLNTMGHQLAAAAFNSMLEFYFSQGE